ncbi:hypothetical protein NOJ37_25060, partial [Escherichia coli]|nr:hypothetical protein [Escherichia coli]
SISKKLLIFRHHAHPRTFAPSELKRAGGSRKNFSAPARKKARPRAGFCGGLAPHTVGPGNISRPSGGYYRLGATTPFKAAFQFFRACEEKIG